MSTRGLFPHAGHSDAAKRWIGTARCADHEHLRSDIRCRSCRDASTQLGIGVERLHRQLVALGLAHGPFDIQTADHIERLKSAVKESE